MPITNFEEYSDALEARLGRSRQVMRVFIHKAQRSPARVVFPEGTEDKILRACQIIADERIAKPVLLGNPEAIREKIESLNLDLNGIEIINPKQRHEIYAEELFKLRRRKGVTRQDADLLLKNPKVVAALMLHLREADAMVSGITQHFPETIRTALQIIKPEPGIKTVAGVYMMILKNQTFFIADPVMNIDPSPEELAQIAILAAETAKSFEIDPRVAMISYSNFGSSTHPQTQKIQQALKIIRTRAPWIAADGEMQADIALNSDLLNGLYPFNELKSAANVLVFPDLTSANTSYKLLVALAGAVAVGPLLKGISRPVYLLQMSSTVNDIVNVTAMAVTEVQQNRKHAEPLPDLFEMGSAELIKA